MLIEFRIKNFKSYKEEQTLSMIASSDKSLSQNTIATEALRGHRLLRSVVIYGANASGKSNLIDAFEFVRRFVRTSVERKPETDIPVQPFRLDKQSIKSPSIFELSFIQGGVRYQYGFSVDRRRVYDEWLIAYPMGRAQTWFERPDDAVGDPDKWYFGPNLKGEKKRLVGLIRPDALFLSVAAKFAQDQLTPIYEWFSECLRTANLSEVPEREAMKDFTATGIVEDGRFRGGMTKLLQWADFGISGVDVKKRSLKEVDLPLEIFSDEGRSLLAESEFFDIKMLHQVSDSDNGGIFFSLDDESCGTQRFFELAGPWLYSIGMGCTLVVDEIDTSLHPFLVRSLVELFHNPDLGKSNAQLVFNTHDTTQLDSSLFRRDQIWFVEKDDTGGSQLYPLIDFRPRRDEALERGYLQGRYGAIPFIGDLEGFDLNVET
jgi:AAA15 family ATPase/GTPase